MPTVGDSMAATIRAHRLRNGLSIRQLAEQCALHGAPQLTAASLSNIERGQDPDARRKRRDVSVEELLVLAHILKAPPAELMFEPSAREIEVAPGVVVRPFVAWSWLFGFAPMSDIWGTRVIDDTYIPNAYHGWRFIDEAYYTVIQSRKHLDEVKVRGRDVNQPGSEPGAMSPQGSYEWALNRLGIGLADAGLLSPYDLPAIPRWLHDDLRAREMAGQIRMFDPGKTHPRVGSDGWVVLRLPKSIAVIEDGGTDE